MDIPDGVKVELAGRKVKVTGPKGMHEEDMSHLPVTFKLEGRSVSVRAEWARKREAALVGTAAARIRNLIKGVTEGFTYKLKIVYAHFPVTVKVLEKDRRILIENFTGEKTARHAIIVGDTKVKASGDDVLVSGTNLEHVSQTAANIQFATKIKEKDQRVFLDGIYVYEKAAGMQA